MALRATGSGGTAAVAWRRRTEDSELELRAELHKERQPSEGLAQDVADELGAQGGREARQNRVLVEDRLARVVVYSQA